MTKFVTTVEVSCYGELVHREIFSDYGLAYDFERLYFREPCYKVLIHTEEVCTEIPEFYKENYGATEEST